MVYFCSLKKGFLYLNRMVEICKNRSDCASDVTEEGGICKGVGKPIAS